MPDRAGQTIFRENGLESFRGGLPGRGPGITGGGVEWDQVHLRVLALKEPADGMGVFRGIVPSLDEGPLVKNPPLSSSRATSVRLLTLFPVYTPSNVSNVLPRVSNVAIPPATGVHENQADAPPGLPACLGSPASLLLKKFVPNENPDGPLRTRL